MHTALQQRMRTGVRFGSKADIAISSAVPVNSSILRRQGLDPEVLLNRFHLSPPAWGYSADGSVVRNSNQRLKSKTVNSPNVVTTSAVRCMMSAADTQLAWPPPVVCITGTPASSPPLLRSLEAMRSVVFDFLSHLALLENE